MSIDLKDLEVIDVWMQHPTNRFISQPFFDSLKRWRQGENSIGEISLEFTDAAMAQVGVSKALMSAWYGPQGALISNDEVANFVQQYSDRYVGVAGVDASKPMAGVRELRRCVKELGFKALRIVQWLWCWPSDDRHYYPLYAECVDLGIPVCLQVGHTGPLCTSETGRPVPYLDNVALDFPELKIVGGHIGYPWTTEMTAVATKHENVYTDTSAYKAHRYPRELVEYMNSHGKEKVMFGTNFPMITPKACLQRLHELDLSEDVCRAFLSGNARAVFGL